MQGLNVKAVKGSFFEEVTQSTLKGDAQTVQTTSIGSVSLEAEIPEVLYKEMKEFIGTNPEWDQYSLMSSALANFLFQNGCGNRAVTERYLNDLFCRSDNSTT